MPDSVPDSVGGRRRPRLRTADVVVLGAGPAGLATADVAARGGLRVLVVDENPRVGGQIGRLPFSGRPVPVEMLHPNVELLARRICIGWDGAAGGFLVQGPEGLERVRGRVHVVAVGAFERVYPVRGWTKKGVITAGAAQALLKGSGSLPYRRVLVAGTGPLLLATAAQLLAAGVDVAGVVEAVRPGRQQLPHLAGLLRGRGLLLQGLGYVGSIASRRVRVRQGWAVTEVIGGDVVEGARLRRVDHDGRPLQGADVVVECDAVLLSQGFSPATDLVTQAGARLEWSAVRAAWEPVRSDSFETSVPGLFAIGDSARVAGAQVARAEGELLGHLLVEQLLGGSPRREVSRLRRRLKRLDRFRAHMDAVFEVGPGTTTAADDDVVACRCQGTTVGQLRAAAGQGAAAPGTVKLWTRAGMGVCQGRTCHHVVAALTSAADPATRQPPTVRFPIRPTPFAVLASALEPPRQAPPEGTTTP